MSIPPNQNCSRLTASPAIGELDILWITAGLGCDGDTIAVTAAAQPALEEILLGALPGIPKACLHNSFLNYAAGDQFLKPFFLAAEDSARPFILVVEGSIPDERNKDAGYWAAFGSDKATREPITTCEWMPGFPDKFMPFMNQPPGSILSTTAVMTYGKSIRALRSFTQASLNKEPEWRPPKNLSAESGGDK